MVKSVQALRLIVEFFQEEPDRGPMLVLVPSVGMIKQWVSEVSKFTYGLTVIGVEKSHVSYLIFICRSFSNLQLCCFSKLGL